MIVRISGEGQFELADDLYDQLDALDDATVEAVDGGDADGFRQRFDALLAFVRTHGSTVNGDDLRESRVILPPADLSFDEASREFTGEGLVP